MKQSHQERMLIAIGIKYVLLAAIPRNETPVGYQNCLKTLLLEGVLLKKKY